MNIFYLDSDPRLAAQMQCDKHVVKMILESAQMLCTAHNLLNPQYPAPYRSTHINHPSNVWVRSNVTHYSWLLRHFIALCGEYNYRYNKIHKTQQYSDFLIWFPTGLPYGEGFTPPPQCMPDEYKLPDTVEAYRKYYKYGKAHILKYTRREAPAWLSTTSV